MRSIIRLGAVLGVIGSTFLMTPDPTLRLFGSVPLGIQPAYAIPQEQILEKLRPVPVFTVTDADGAPLVATVSQGNNKNASVAGVFISRNDALAFVERLKSRDPQLASTVQVRMVSLGEVYQKSQQAQTSADDIQFAYLPGQKQVDSAKAVLQQNGQSTEFNGVPLFIAKGGPDNGYLTIQNGQEQVIPIFFSKEDLQGMLTQFKEQQPDLIASVKIDVVYLEVLLEALKQDNDQFLNRIVLIPPRETIEYLQQNQPRR